MSNKSLNSINSLDSKEEAEETEMKIKNVNSLMYGILQDLDSRFKGEGIDFFEAIDLSDFDFSSFNFKNPDSVIKIKESISKLAKMDEKMDSVCKEIVKVHSIEFLQILGFLRQMQKITDDSSNNINHIATLIKLSKDFYRDIADAKENMSK